MVSIRLAFPDGTVKTVDMKYVHTVYDVILRWMSIDVSIVPETAHKAAADAEGWAELASVGERYESSDIPGFRIDIVEDF